MTESVWNGSNGNYLNPHNWSNGQVPQDGNDGFITAGVAHVAETTITANIWLFSAHPVHDPELSLNNSTIIGPFSDEGAIVVASPTATVGTSYGDLDVAGKVNNDGVIIVGQDEGVNGNLDIRLAAGAKLENNNGIIVDSDSFADVIGKSGSSMSNTDAYYGILVNGTMVIDVPITGKGGINIYSSSFGKPSLTINSSVSAGQTVNLNDPDLVGPGSQPEATLRLDEPMRFLGTVDAGVSSRVVLASSHETGFSYLNDILKVYDHDHVIASFKYTAETGAFTVSNSGHDVIVETRSAPTYSPDQHPAALMIGSHS